MKMMKLRNGLGTIRLFSTGFVRAFRPLFEPVFFPEMIHSPAVWALIEHKKRGIYLFDTGYSHRFFEATTGFPQLLMHLLTPLYLKEGESCLEQLQELGISAEAVEGIILSHLDADHCGGLKDFPRCRFYLASEAVAFLSNHNRSILMQFRYFENHFPEDFQDRIECIDRFPDLVPEVNVRGVDLFGDSSLMVVPLPGHFPGQVGLFLPLDDEKAVFLVGDAIWTIDSISGKTIDTRMHRFLATDPEAQKKTYSLLQRFYQKHKNVTLVPSHCPITAKELNITEDY